MIDTHDERQAARFGNRIADLLHHTHTSNVEDALAAEPMVLGRVLDAWGWTLTPTSLKRSPLDGPAPKFEFTGTTKLGIERAMHLAILWEIGEGQQ